MPKASIHIEKRTLKMEAMYVSLFARGYKRTRIVKKIADQFFMDKTTVYRYLPVSDIRKKHNLTTNGNNNSIIDHSINSNRI